MGKKTDNNTTSSGSGIPKRGERNDMRARIGNKTMRKDRDCELE